MAQIPIVISDELKFEAFLRGMPPDPLTQPAFWQLLHSRAS